MDTTSERAKAEQALAEAVAAMTNPTCHKTGIPAPLPAVQCNPDLAKRVDEAQSNLRRIVNQSKSDSAAQVKTKYIVGAVIATGARAASSPNFLDQIKK